MSLQQIVIEPTQRLLENSVRLLRPWEKLGFIGSGKGCGNAYVGKLPGLWAAERILKTRFGIFSKSCEEADDWAPFLRLICHRIWTKPAEGFRVVTLRCAYASFNECPDWPLRAVWHLAVSRAMWQFLSSVHAGSCGGRKLTKGGTT